MTVAKEEDEARQARMTKEEVGVGSTAVMKERVGLGPQLNPKGLKEAKDVVGWTGRDERNQDSAYDRQICRTMRTQDSH